jgi:hypothetical protein
VRVLDTTQLSHASERHIPTEHGVSERPSKIVKIGRDIAAKLMIGGMIGGISVLCVLVASDWVRPFTGSIKQKLLQTQLTE